MTMKRKSEPAPPAMSPPPKSLSANQMTVSVTGATGFIVRDFPGIIIADESGWKDCIEGSNAVVNLAGMPRSIRWSPEAHPGAGHPCPGAGYPRRIGKAIPQPCPGAGYTRKL
ncbi:hypothetical protein CCACVL1_22321 [Corchorus capsularis]|uniref:Uncharacterized protein n=1 Tax=Corchorus capsularis TaxID=210143 RepID=A0A1R3H036_COCAP|nr:hypothetical protein CCACVL1_22321 [Corchorus capsularis]